MATTAEQQMAAMELQHQQQLQQQQDQTRKDKQDLREQMEVELEKIRADSMEMLRKAAADSTAAK